mmetsp:Transcript_22658/g.42593  ORF Transcript_22658/g.42593 Transcript_22658/m.42593 type:complete len:153 (-) Transcript_22658:34-492(-)
MISHRSLLLPLSLTLIGPLIGFLPPTLSSSPIYISPPPPLSQCYPSVECLKCEVDGDMCETGKRTRIECKGEEGEENVNSVNSYHYKPCSSTSSDLLRSFYVFFFCNILLFIIVMYRVRSEVKLHDNEFDRRRREGYTPVKKREEMIGIEMT